MSDIAKKHMSFEAESIDMNCVVTTKTISIATLNGQIAMRIPGFDSDCTFITKEQAMNFFDLVEQN